MTFSAKAPRRATLCAFAIATAALSALSGCVVAIGNDGPSYRSIPSRQRIYLTSDERATLPQLSTLADAPTFSSKYASTLAGMGPSTTIDQFQRAFPTAQYIERRTSAAGTIDAYRVSGEEKFRYRNESYGYCARYEGWFFFKDGTLLKWRENEQWP